MRKQVSVYVRKVNLNVSDVALKFECSIIFGRKSFTFADETTKILCLVVASC